MRYNIGDRPEMKYRLRVDGVLTAGATVTATVTKPNGTAAAAPTVVDQGGGDYLLTLAAVDASGVWRVTVTASGQDVEDIALYVTPADADLPWAPSFTDVAALVPMRTIELGNLTGTPSGTFTPLTMPNDQAVYAMIDGAVQQIAGAVGTVDPSLYALASDMAAVYAAARVELAQPSDQQDARRFQQLTELYDSGLETLIARNVEVTGEGGVDAGLPVYSYPDPVTWGDDLVVFG